MMGVGDYPPYPKSVFFELMDFTTIVSEKYQMSPFAVLKEDKDSVLMLINYYIQKSEETQKVKPNNIVGSKTRVRVNDKTATGGWF